MAASCDLLDIEPPELQFPPCAVVLGKQVSCPLQLSNRTDRTVAFKVKTTSPRKYCVRPNNGVVPPRSSCTVVVTMQAQKVAPPDLQCKDKFMVQSVVVSDRLRAKDITPQMFIEEQYNVVEEVKLKVSYVMPPEPSSEIAEECDDSERILVPMQRIVDNGRSTSERSSGSVSLQSAEEMGSPVGRIVKSEDFLKTAEPALETKANAGPAEHSHQLSAIVAKLIEEKNSALEQNRKLREELELLKLWRKGSNQKGGLSQALLIAIGFLGIILGYFVKK